MINTINTEIGAKHLNSAPTIPSFTVKQRSGGGLWEGNEDILISGFEAKRKKINRMELFSGAKKHIINIYVLIRDSNVLQDA